MNSLHGFLTAEAMSYVKLRYSVFSLVISGVTSVLAGIFLSKSEALILAVPGLLVLLPAALDIRGCIFGTLSSRLGSAFHIGTLKSFDLKNKVLRVNVFASFSLSVVLSVYLGIISKILTYLFGLPAIPLEELVSISLIAGLLSGVLLTVASIWISFLAYKRNWDTDNVTSPLVTSEHVPRSHILRHGPQFRQLQAHNDGIHARPCAVGASERGFRRRTGSIRAHHNSDTRYTDVHPVVP